MIAVLSTAIGKALALLKRSYETSSATSSCILTEWLLYQLGQL